MLLVLRTYVFHRLLSKDKGPMGFFQDCYLEQRQDSFHHRNMHVVGQHIIPHL